MTDFKERERNSLSEHCPPITYLTFLMFCSQRLILEVQSCLAGDDHQALIWDIQQMPRAIEDPILAYTADGEINQIQWASTQPDWIGICYNNNLEILRV